MYFCLRIGVCLLAATTMRAAETRAYTVAVDAKSGRLVRVPARRYSRAAAARAVQAKTVPEKVIEAREVKAETPGSEASYNAVPARPIEELIDRVAYQYGIRPSFVHAVIKSESNYNPMAISPKGALGLMQLMPHTARRFGVGNVFNPAENLEGGVRYLRYLLDLYGPKTELSLAAYNAGEGAVDRYRGIPPYLETRQFVQRVNRYYQSYRSKEKLAPVSEAGEKDDSRRVRRVVETSGFIRYTNYQ